MRVYEGEAARYAAAGAAEVILSDGAGPAIRMPVADGEAVFSKLAVGRYWAVSRAADGTMAKLDPLDVVPIHDPIEV